MQIRIGDRNGDLLHEVSQQDNPLVVILSLLRTEQHAQRIFCVLFAVFFAVCNQIGDEVFFNQFLSEVVACLHPTVPEDRLRCDVDTAIFFSALVVTYHDVTSASAKVNDSHSDSRIFCMVECAGEALDVFVKLMLQGSIEIKQLNTSRFIIHPTLSVLEGVKPFVDVFLRGVNLGGRVLPFGGLSDELRMVR